MRNLFPKIANYRIFYLYETSILPAVFISDSHGMFLAFPKNMYKILTLIFLAGLQFYALGQTPDTGIQSRPDINMQNNTDTTKQAFADEKLSGNKEVYKLQATSDIPIIAIGTGWRLYAFS
jgi:hypothetical protein